jgi:hypothetical protein
MEYYVYTYFYEDGTAYYVGKGSRKRIFMRHDVPVPKQQLIQYFPFETEVEAWDTEIQLIAFYGRQQEGGTLMNLSTGGRSGTAGVVRTPEQKQQQSIKAKRLIKERGHPQQGRRGSRSHNSLPYVITTPDGNTINIRGLTQFCRENNLSPSALVAVSKGKRSHHKGYKCSRI